MRVIYGTELNIDVDDSLTKAEILATLSETYAELKNASATITTNAEGERTMTISLRTGNKA